MAIKRIDAVVDLIDNALSDYSKTVSEDAMRWTPEPVDEVTATGLALEAYVTRVMATAPPTYADDFTWEVIQRTPHVHAFTEQDALRDAYRCACGHWIAGEVLRRRPTDITDT